jgi:hypothetical protein
MDTNVTELRPAPLSNRAKARAKNAAEWAAAKAKLSKATAAPAPTPAPPAEPPPEPTPALPAPAAVEPTTHAEAPKTVCPILQRILCWKRPFESKAELEFMTWLHGEIKLRGGEAQVRTRGNVVVEIKRSDAKKCGTLFSCHTDTVHHSSAEPQQKLVYDADFGHIFLDKNAPNPGSCLGADDGAGVWLMLEMIAAKVPGTYVFHRGEERGGVGAHAMVVASADWLRTFDLAIAFDRAGTGDVITHQGGLRCASDKFGTALAAALNTAGGFKYTLSTGGTFTDTKVYARLISECTNISVGYMNQHGQDETLDYTHLVALRDAVLKIDWDSLPADRDPAKEESMPSKYPYVPGAYKGWEGFDRGPWKGYNPAHDDLDRYPSKPASKKGKKGKSAPPPQQRQLELELAPEDEFANMHVDDIVALIEDDPATIAALIVDLASEVKALRAKVEYMKGALK